MTAYLTLNSDVVGPVKLEGIAAVGITAGTSTLEELVKELLDRLDALFNIRVEAMNGISENAYFQLRPELTAPPACQ